MRRLVIIFCLAIFAAVFSNLFPAVSDNGKFIPQRRAEALANPITEYETYDAAKQAIGFAPLYLPRIAGWNLYYISTVNGDLADLGYSRAGSPEAELRIRTAEASASRKDNISGIYSNDWVKYELSPRLKEKADVEAQICKYGEKGYAVFWKTGGYLFSVQSEGLSRTEFLTLFEDALIDLSTHYYPVNKNAITTEY